MTIRDRARRYVARMPEAISGQHGHSTMFNVACVLVQGFDLNMSDARTLLEEYNTTLTEPFSTGEIKHKPVGDRHRAALFVMGLGVSAVFAGSKFIGKGSMPTSRNAVKFSRRCSIS